MVLVGVGQQNALDHITAHAVAFQLVKRLVQCRHILTQGVLFLAMILDWLPDSGINENAAARRAQIGAVATAAATETHEAQSLTKTSIAGLARSFISHNLVG